MADDIPTGTYTCPVDKTVWDSTEIYRDPQSLCCSRLICGDLTCGTTVVMVSELPKTEYLKSLEKNPRLRSHPELRPREVFVGNVTRDQFDRDSYKTKRLGNLALNPDGTLLPAGLNARPMFVSETEYLAVDAEVKRQLAEVE